VSATIPLVRAAPLRFPVEFLESTGAPVERILERARLSYRAIENPDALIPFAAAARFLEEAARDQGIDDLGLRIGTLCNVGRLGTFGRMIVGSATVGEAFETAYRVWAGFNSGVRTWLTRRGEQVELHHRFVYGDCADWGQYAAATLMTYLTFLGSAAGPGWSPTAVGVPLRSLPGARSVPLLRNTRIELGRPWTTVTFAATVLGRPLATLPQRPMTPAETGWDDGGPAGDVGGAVEQIVTAMLADGYPDIRVVAEAIALSPRTLQRRLHREGLTFGGVVAKARFTQARHMLNDPSRKVIDVALDLGYSDPAHFTRAFERWSGIGPREFRRRATGGPIPASGPDAA
jgi:AraC-like DNA-binding protein